MNKLEIAIQDMPEEQARWWLKQEIEDWAETDTLVRKLASQVLTDFEVNGDSYGVPMIEDIVEALVKKIHHLRFRIQDLDSHEED